MAAHDAPRHRPTSGPPRWTTWLGALARAGLLNASLTFTNVWPTPKIRWDWALSLDLACIVLAMTIAPRVSVRLSRWGWPLLWLVLVIGRYIAVTGPGLYGREFNLHWDGPHLGNVIAMLARAVPAWMLLTGVIVAVVTLAGAFLLARVGLETGRDPRRRTWSASPARIGGIRGRGRLRACRHRGRRC
jgi:hypothetical protein